MTFDFINKIRKLHIKKQIKILDNYIDRKNFKNFLIQFFFIVQLSKGQKNPKRS